MWGDHYDLIIDLWGYFGFFKLKLSYSVNVMLASKSSDIYGVDWNIYWNYILHKHNTNTRHRKCEVGSNLYLINYTRKLNIKWVEIIGQLEDRTEIITYQV